MKVGENPTGADPPKVTLPPPRYTVLQPPTQDFIAHCSALSLDKNILSSNAFNCGLPPYHFTHSMATHCLDFFHNTKRLGIVVVAVLPNF